MHLKKEEAGRGHPMEKVTTAQRTKQETIT